MIYQSFALGKWVTGDGEGTPLYNSITGEEVGRAGSKGLDFRDMLDFARNVGGAPLKK